MVHKKQHTLWFKIVAWAVVCLLLMNDVAFAFEAKFTPNYHTLAPASQFSPVTRAVPGIRRTFTIASEIDADNPHRKRMEDFGYSFHGDRIYKRLSHIPGEVYTGALDPYRFHNCYEHLMVNAFDAIIDRMEEFRFKGFTGEVIAQVYLDGDEIVLSIQDNGKTIEFDVYGQPVRRPRDPEKQHGGRGEGPQRASSLLAKFCRRFDATLHWYQLENGTRAEIRVPRKNIPHEYFIGKNEYIVIEDGKETRAKFQAALICKAIEARAGTWRGKTINEIYNDDILLWKRSHARITRGCTVQCLPGEIRISIPGSKVCIRYYDAGEPETNRTLVPYTDWTKTTTRPVTDRITRQILSTTESLPLPGTSRDRSDEIRELTGSLAIVPIDSLVPIEETLGDKVGRVQDDHDEAGAFYEPITVDRALVQIGERQCHVVLDGMHRLRAMKERGYDYMVVRFVDYDSPGITLRQTNEAYTGEVTKEAVRQKASQRRLFPPKTVRHFFRTRVVYAPVPLEFLKKQEGVSLPLLNGALRKALSAARIRYVSQGMQSAWSTYEEDIYAVPREERDAFTERFRSCVEQEEELRILTALKTCVRWHHELPQDRIEELTLTVVPDEEVDSRTGFAREGPHIRVTEDDYRLFASRDPSRARSVFVKNLFRQAVAWCVESTGDEVLEERWGTFIKGEGPVRELELDKFTTNMILAIEEAMRWDTRFLTVAQCRALMTRHKNGETVNIWHLFASLIMLTPDEKTELLEWINDKGMYDWNDFVSGRIRGILERGQFYYIDRQGRGGEGIYRHFPVFSIWETLHNVAVERQDNLFLDRMGQFDERHYDAAKEKEFIKMAQYKHLWGHGFRNNTVRGEGQVARIYGEPYVLCDHWAMLGVMIDGRKPKGEFGRFLHFIGTFLDDLGYDNAGLYGPYYLLAGKRKTEGRNFTTERFSHLFVVPDEADPVFVREALKIGVHRGIVSLERANNALARMITYDQALEHKDDIEKILNEEVAWDNGVELLTDGECNPRDPLAEESIQESLTRAMEIFPQLAETPGVRIVRSGKDAEAYQQRMRERMAETGYAAPPRRRRARVLRTNFAINNGSEIVIIPRNARYFGGMGAVDQIIAHETGESLYAQIGYNVFLNRIRRDDLQWMGEQDRWFAPNLVGDLVLNTVMLRADRARYTGQCQTLFETRRDYYRTHEPHLYRAYNLYTRTLEVMTGVEKGTFCEYDESLDEKAAKIAEAAESIVAFITACDGAESESSIPKEVAAFTRAITLVIASEIERPKAQRGGRQLTEAKPEEIERRYRAQQAHLARINTKLEEAYGALAADPARRLTDDIAEWLEQAVKSAPELENPSGLETVNEGVFVIDANQAMIKARRDLLEAVEVPPATWFEPTQETSLRDRLLAYRTYNIFPATNAKFMKYSLGEEVVTIFDLEDSVVASRKEEGRRLLIETFSDPKFQAAVDGSNKSLWIRVNDVRSRHIARDLFRVIAHPEVGKRIDGIFLPKVECAADAVVVESILKSIQRRRAREGHDGWEPGRLKIQALIESARSVENIDEIAQEPAVVSLISGLLDYKTTMGEWDAHHQFPDSLFEKSEIVRAGKAHGVLTIDGVTSILDYDRAFADTKKAIAVGFFGRWSVHPEHVRACRDAAKSMGGWPEYELTMRDYDGDGSVPEYNLDELSRRSEENTPLVIDMEEDSIARREAGNQDVVWRVYANWRDFDEARSVKADAVHIVIVDQSDIAGAQELYGVLRENKNIESIAIDIKLKKDAASQNGLLPEVLDAFKDTDGIVLRGNVTDKNTLRRVNRLIGEWEAAAPGRARKKRLWLGLALTNEIQCRRLHDVLRGNPRVACVVNDYAPMYGDPGSPDLFLTAQDTRSKEAIRLGRILNACRATGVRAIQGRHAQRLVAHDVRLAAKLGYEGYVIANPDFVPVVRRALRPNDALIIDALHAVKGLHHAEGRYALSKDGSLADDHAQVADDLFTKTSGEIVGATKITSHEFFEPDHEPQGTLVNKASQGLMSGVLNRARVLHRREVALGFPGFLSLEQLREIELYANPKLSTQGWEIDFSEYEPLWDDKGSDTFSKIRSRITGEVYLARSDGTYPIPYVPHYDANPYAHPERLPYETTQSPFAYGHEDLANMARAVVTNGGPPELLENVLHGTIKYPRDYVSRELNAEEKEAADIFEAHLGPHFGKPWRGRGAPAASFDSLNQYLYFLANLICGYYQTGRDPYAIKNDERITLGVAYLKDTIDAAKDAPAAREALYALVTNILFANKYEGTREFKEEPLRVVSDQRDALVAAILSVGPDGILDLFPDNVGPEFTANLQLVDYCLANGIAGKVRVHVKPAPISISDVCGTRKDIFEPHIGQSLTRMKKSGDRRLISFAGRIEKYIGSGALELKRESFSAEPAEFRDNREKLQRAIAGSRCAIFVGDLLHRRVFGAREFPHTDDVSVVNDILAYTGVPTGIIRIIKSNLKLGTPAGTPEDGTVGMVQVAGTEAIIAYANPESLPYRTTRDVGSFPSYAVRNGAASIAAQGGTDILIRDIESGAPIRHPRDYIDGGLTAAEKEAAKPFIDLLEPHFGKPWIGKDAPDVSFMMLDIYQYFLTDLIAGHYRTGVDPYKEKNDERIILGVTYLKERFKTAQAGTTHAERVESLLTAILSANRYEGTREFREGDLKIASDQRGELTRAILAVGPSGTLDIFPDNVGPELTANLLLIDYLLSHDLVGTVRTHVKCEPFIVSDVWGSRDDVSAPHMDATLKACRLSRDPRLAGLAGRIRRYIDEGRVTLQRDAFLTHPRDFREEREALHAALAGSQCALFVGDYLYRKLFGSRAFPHTEHAGVIDNALRYVGVPTGIVRIIKCDLKPGTPADTPEDGTAGMVQVAGYKDAEKDSKQDRKKPDVPKRKLSDLLPKEAYEIMEEAFYEAAMKVPLADDEDWKMVFEKRDGMCKVTCNELMRILEERGFDMAGIRILKTHFAGDAEEAQNVVSDGIYVLDPTVGVFRDTFPELVASYEEMFFGLLDDYLAKYHSTYAGLPPLARYVGTAVEEVPAPDLSQSVVEGRTEPLNILLVVPPARSEAREYPSSAHYIASALLDRDFLTQMAQRLHEAHPDDAFYRTLSGLSNGEMPACTVEVLDFKAAGDDLRFGSFLDGRRKGNDRVYDVIAFSTFTEGFKQVQGAVEAARKVSPESAVILGGWHASALPEDTIADTGCDLVVKGHGIEAMADIVLRLHFSDEAVPGREQIRNIAPFMRGMYYAREKESCITTGERPALFTFDEYPFPHRSFHTAAYPPEPLSVLPGMAGEKGMKCASVFCSIGCPYRCNYCSVHIINERRRERDIDVIRQEIEELYEAGYRGITFSDDILALSRERALEITELMAGFKARAEKEGDIFVWTCMLRADLEFLDEGLFRAMRQSGCPAIAFGIESGDIAIARTVKNTPHMSEETIMKNIRSAMDAGIFITAFLQVGHPNERMQDVLKSALLATSGDVAEISVFRTVPYAGSAYFDTDNNGPVKVIASFTDIYHRTITQTDTMLPDEITLAEKCMSGIGECLDALVKKKSLGELIEAAADIATKQRALFGLLRIATIADLVVSAHPSMPGANRVDVFGELMSAASPFFISWGELLVLAHSNKLKERNYFPSNPFSFVSGQPVNERDFDRFLTGISFTNGFEHLKTFDWDEIFFYMIFLFDLWTNTEKGFDDVRFEGVDTASVKTALEKIAHDMSADTLSLEGIFGPEETMHERKLAIGDVQFSIHDKTLVISPLSEEAPEEAPARAAKWREEPLNILLVVPPYEVSPLYPLSAHYLASTLIDTKFLALLARRLHQENPDDAFYKELASLSAEWMPAFNVEVLDMSAAGFDFDLKAFLEEKKKLEQKTYHLVGFSTFTEGLKQAKEAMRAVREVSPASAVVAGGWHASALPEATMAESGCDLLVTGHGVEALADTALRLFFSGDASPMREQVKAIAPSMKGVYYEKAQDSFVYTGDRSMLFTFDEYPFPHKSFANAVFPPLEHRELFGETAIPEDVKIANIFSSIGCPFNCRYCAVHIINKGRTERDIKCLQREVEELYERGFRRISFGDDIFALTEERVLEIAGMMREFKERADREGGFFAWDCMMRADTVTGTMLRAMQASGMVEITFGLESGDIDVARYVKNTTRLDEERIAQTVRTALDMGIFVNIFMQVGQPTETVQSVLKSARFIVNTDGARLSVFRTRPYAGSDYYDPDNNGPVRVLNDATDNDIRLLTETDTMMRDEITFARECLIALDAYVGHQLGQIPAERMNILMPHQEKAILGLLRVATVVDLVIRAHDEGNTKTRTEIYRELMGAKGLFYKDYDEMIQAAQKHSIYGFRLFHDSPYKLIDNRPVDAREFDRFLTGISFSNGFDQLKRFNWHQMYGYTILLYRLWKDSGEAFRHVRFENVSPNAAREALDDLIYGSEDGKFTLRRIAGPEAQLHDGKLAIGTLQFAVENDTLVISSPAAKTALREDNPYAQYIESHRPLIGTLLADTTGDALLRVPIEVIEATGVENARRLLEAFQRAPNGYVELYYMSGERELTESEQKTLLARYGLRQKPVPQGFRSTKENTVTLFALMKGEISDDENEAKREIQRLLARRLGGVKPGKTQTIPVGLQNDGAGLVRSALFGVRLLHIARQQRELGRVDADFVRETVEQYRDLCDAQGVTEFDLTAEDIMEIATGGLNQLIRALTKLIRLLPIVPIDAEELRQIYERAQEVLVAA